MKKIIKPKFVWTKNGFYKNVTPKIIESYVGYIEERNEEDKKFYEDRMKLLENVFADMFTHMVKKIAVQTEGEIKILDVGCGDGVVLAAINKIKKAQKMNIKLYGIDLDEKAMKKIKFPAKLVVGSATDMPFDDNMFHIVFSSQTLEHFTETQLDKSLLEIHRVLSPGGIFYAETPNPQSLLAKVMKSDWWMLLPEHLLLMPPATLRQILLKAGFKDIKVFSRSEIDEQINEIREIILRLDLPLLKLLPVRLKYFLLKKYVNFTSKGSITVCLAKKEVN